MSSLLDLVRELNTLNDDNLANRVIANNDVQWCLGELQDILEAEEDTSVGGKGNNAPTSGPLTCTGCQYLDEQCAPCASCIRAQKYADYYRDEAPTIAPQDEPLTIEQLRQMDGHPVWIKRLKGLSVCDTGWALIDTCTDRIRVWWPGSEVEDTPSGEDYGKTWVAYGSPPERQEDNNETGSC